jgi:hypothetical protein
MRKFEWLSPFSPVVAKLKKNSHAPDRSQGVLIVLGRVERVISSRQKYVTIGVRLPCRNTNWFRWDFS